MNRACLVNKKPVIKLLNKLLNVMLSLSNKLFVVRKNTI